MQVHDIEDLNKACFDKKVCAYYAARELAENADIVFTPYW